MVELEVLDYQKPTYTIGIMRDRKFERDSGVYALVNQTSGEVYYVGVTGNLKTRMSQHRSSWTPSSLHNTLFENYQNNELVGDILDETIVKFWRVNNFYKQDFFEQYFILTLNPTFNRERILNRKDRITGIKELKESVS